MHIGRDFSICAHERLTLGSRAYEDLGFLAQVGVLIVGAGPTGLGAATRLNQHGVDNWLLVDEVTSDAGSVPCHVRRLEERCAACSHAANPHC
jgi:heterodisulfide reductase subunit A-like polyferredoxin